MADTHEHRGYTYDIFISHNRADKEWVRALTDRLAGERYNGRPLRPWLDEHFLDPGRLGSEAELTTALDRSRFLGLVLSPEALASEWVDFELRYFLDARGGEAVIPLMRRDCHVPESLRGLPALDFGDGGGEESFATLVAKLCPAGGVRPEDVRRGVDAAYGRVEASDPGGYGPGTSPERDAFFAEVLRHDIDDAVSEGLAVAAFERAAEHLQPLGPGSSPAAYNYKMLLAECLGAALHRSASYRQVAQSYIDAAARRPGSPPVPLFVVARAYSKLAEIDPGRVDLSVLLRLISQLDAAVSYGNEERAVEALLVRTVGKLRATRPGEFMLKALGEGGRASRVVTAGAVSLNYKSAGPVFYLSELERLHEGRPPQQQQPAGEPPSRALLGLLDALDLYQHESVGAVLRNAKAELERDYPGIDFPYALFWLDVRKGGEATNLHNAPFMGTVAKATLGNMVGLADRVGVANVACLTEPRVVDALFDKCGALLVLPQDADSPQCRRLRDRGIPFGVASRELMDGLADGEHVIVSEKGVSIRKARP